MKNKFNNKHEIDSGFIRNRVSELRIKLGKSEIQMSLDLGHSTSYIQSITSGRALPSMREMFSICDYFGISIYDFFCPYEFSDMVSESLDILTELKEDDLKFVIDFMSRICATYPEKKQE